jgi:hypothetical protein
VCLCARTCACACVHVCLCVRATVRMNGLFTLSAVSTIACVCLLVRQVSLSDARSVTLLNVQKELTGVYKCEVSADAPLFHTEIKSASITVVCK